jgi:hypothetical protein
MAATVELRGYVNKPEAKKAGTGREYSKFSLGVKQTQKAYKDNPEEVTWANFFVTDYNSSSPPNAKAFVTVKGYLTVKEVEKDGSKRTYLEVNAKSVDVAPPLDGNSDTGAAKVAAKSDKDPWDE